MTALVVGAAWVEVLAIAGRRLRQLRRAPARLIGITVNPLISMVVLGYLFREAIAVPGAGSYQEYLFAGAVVQVGLAGIGPTALAVATDLRGGLVDRLRSMPVSRAAVPFGHTAADLLASLVSLAVVLAVGLLLGWRPHGGPLATLAGFGLAVLFAHLSLWVGVLIGTRLRNVESISSLTQFLVVVLPFLSTAFLSAASFPAAIRPLAEWNPISAVMSCLRVLWGNDKSASTPAWLVAVVLALLTALVVGLCVRRFTLRGGDKP
ncbi:ABC transporter permease [Kutzneria viridogrisea]|uniref:Transport permease protein n=2 Tax=Kutzneria TaxID=43356 RepID=W5WES8_9PSEU|nr:ABC transporter permease [Kutzneria albida]AHH99265.1 hypothetical protein KALB_5904 [Kutzneria albida DSM 43870]MBA8923181.1 ABC transporter DrrB family efflux protein [Kutzneria viridogrisea]